MFDRFVANMIGPAPHWDLPKNPDSALAAELQKVDFGDSQAVAKLHSGLAKTTWLEKFCDWAFYNGAIAQNLSDIATLKMCQVADQRRQEIDEIPGNRLEALKRLATGITPAAREALLTSLADRSVRNEVTEGLAPADRHCLAAHLFLADAKAMPTPQTEEGTIHPTLLKAAEEFRRAGQDYREAGRPGLAVEAHTMAADVFRQMTWPREVAESMWRVANVLAATAPPAQAADAYMVAANLFIESAAACRSGPDARPLAAVLDEMGAGHRFADAADLYAQAGMMGQAGDACMSAASRYLRNVEQPWEVKDAYTQAERYYRLAGRLGDAENARQMAADVRGPGS